MKTGIYFYSRSGNTWQVADILRRELEKAEHECELYELQPLKERFLIYNLLGAIRGKAERTNPFPADVKGYDQIIIGTPTWAGNPVPMINTFFEQVSNLDLVERVILFCTYSMGGDYRVLKKMRAKLPEGNYRLILTKSFCTRRGYDFKEESRNFARDLLRL